MGLNTVGSCDCRCGGCTDCCSGNEPAEWAVTVGVDDLAAPNDCSMCVDFLTGEYVLTPATGCDSGIPDDEETTDCCWKYDWEGDETGDCDDFHITEVHILLVVKCYEETLHITNLSMWVVGHYAGDPGSPYSKAWLFTREGAPGFEYSPIQIPNCTDAISEQTSKLVGALVGHSLWPKCSSTITMSLVPS